MLTKIVIAMHKSYKVPNDETYIPLFVGACGKDDFKLPNGRGLVRDDSGENISDKNAYYCELTGLYYAWKNIDAEAIGLVHYRRYFGRRPLFYKMARKVYDGKSLSKMMDQYDIILPKKRNYYIESLYSHYAHTFDSLHLDVARDVLTELYPDYLNSCERVYMQKSGHMFNMLVMRKEYLDAYLSWLFPILDGLYEELYNDMKDASAFDKRYIGRVAEIMLNVWIDYISSSGLVLSDNLLHYPEITELPAIQMERTNWPKKIASFLGAKFFGVKYNKSF